MGTNYYQQCIIGVHFTEEELKKITSPAVFEKQPRYNTRTGKIDHYETILVKNEEYHYSFMGNDFYDLEDIELFINGLDVLVTSKNENTHLYIGQYIYGHVDYGRVELIETEISADSFIKTVESVSNLLKVDKDKVKMYFVGYVS